jgi:hypothetical protein
MRIESIDSGRASIDSGNAELTRSVVKGFGEDEPRWSIGVRGK